MEFLLFIPAIYILYRAVVRFRKAKQILINDMPSPTIYATADYADAFNQAFKEKGIKFKYYNM